MKTQTIIETNGDRYTIYEVDMPVSKIIKTIECTDCKITFEVIGNDKIECPRCKK